MPDEKDKSLISVKDLAGVSAPLTKLVETVGNVFGRMSDGVNKLITTYLLANKDARNEAERIELVEGAKTRAMTQRAQAFAALSGHAAPKLEAIEVNPDGTIAAKLIGIPVEVQGLSDRAAQRVSYQNAMQQLNLESAVAAAAEELLNETQVAEEPVELGWVNHWTRFAQDASGEEMQILWGRILAGEIKTPGSFSPRTMQVVSLLTQKDAQLFQRLCAFTWRISDGDWALTLLPDYTKQGANVMGFTHQEIQLLSNIGVIDTDFIGGYGINGPEAELSYNQKIIEIHFMGDLIPTGRANLTPIGIEIASICHPEYDECLIDEAVKFWVSKGCQVSSPYQLLQPPKPPDIK